MRFAPLWLLSIWLCASVASADAPYSPPPSQPWREPQVGECLGGDCGTPEPAQAPEPRRSRPRNPRARFAYTSAVLGTVTAGLAFTGSIAIAAVDDVHSERITRAVWLGGVAVVPPLVALSAFVARKESRTRGLRSARALGWTAYGAAVADGAILWYGALKDLRVHPALTVSAGVISLLAFLPHALDALVGARAAVAKRGLTVAPGGVRVRF